MPLLKNKSSTVSIAETKVETVLQLGIRKESKKHAEAEIEVQFYRPIPDTQKVLNYLKTAKIRNIRNKQHLFQTLSNIFKKDPERIEELWYELERTNPILIRLIISKFKDEVLKQQYKRANYEALHPKHRNALNDSEVISPPHREEVNLDLKNVKPIDGVEIEWKQGKMSAVDQKNYRSKFDEQ